MENLLKNLEFYICNEVCTNTEMCKTCEIKEMLNKLLVQYLDALYFSFDDCK